MKLHNLFIAAAFALSATGVQAVTIGGINFADNAFADTLVSSSGNFSVFGDDAPTLASVLTDTDPATFAWSYDSDARLDFAFTDNVIVNGEGADLAIFEMGANDTISVSIGSNVRNYSTVWTETTAGGFYLNVAKVDLSDFGYAFGAELQNVTLGVSIMSPEETVPSVSLVGAINVTPVPEPETYALMALGLGAVAARRLRKRA